MKVNGEEKKKKNRDTRETERDKKYWGYKTERRKKNYGLSILKSSLFNIFYQ